MGKITELKTVDIERLIPYVNNAKKHPDSQIDKLASSIREFGFLSACLIDKDYNVISGHGRILAAKKAGLTEVPCVFAEGLSEAQRKAYILADNRLSELADWDMELVNEELAFLGGAEFDIDITGFEMPDVDDFGEEFTLRDGDREPTITMSITFSDDQAEKIKEAISEIKKTDKFKEYINPYNNNSNGNALYLVVEEWLQQKM